MNTFPSEVKQKLNSIIKEMSDHHWLFTRNPNRDFSRQHLGKLSFYDTMRLIIGMGKGSTADEVNDFFDMDCDKIPSLSAFNQRRSQITLSAFQYLFSEFSSSFQDTTHRFKDHRKPTDLIRLLQKYVHAVKESYRHFERHLHGISAIRFGYR